MSDPINRPSEHARFRSSEKISDLDVQRQGRGLWDSLALYSSALIRPWRTNMFERRLARLISTWNEYKCGILARRLMTQMKSCGESCNIAWPVRFTNPQYISCGSHVTIGPGAWVYGVDRYGEMKYSPHILINDHTSIGQDSHIVACNRVIIGKDVMIANRAYLSDNIHLYEDISKPISHNPLKIGEIFVGDESWIGENVCIYGDVRIGKHCVIGANSVVVRDTPDFSVVVGVPARVVKRYDFEQMDWRKTDPDGSFQ